MDNRRNIRRRAVASNGRKNGTARNGQVAAMYWARLKWARLWKRPAIWSLDSGNMVRWFSNRTLPFYGLAFGRSQKNGERWSAKDGKKYCKIQMASTRRPLLGGVRWSRLLLFSQRKLIGPAWKAAELSARRIYKKWQLSGEMRNTEFLTRHECGRTRADTHLPYGLILLILASTF